MLCGSRYEPRSTGVESTGAQGPGRCMGVSEASVAHLDGLLDELREAEAGDRNQARIQSEAWPRFNVELEDPIGWAVLFGMAASVGRDGRADWQAPGPPVFRAWVLVLESTGRLTRGASSAPRRGPTSPWGVGPCRSPTTLHG